MKFSLTTKTPKLAHWQSNKIDKHAKSLMKDFEAVNLWLQENQEERSNPSLQRLKKNITRGVKQAVALGLEDVLQGVRQKVDENLVKEIVEREVTKQMSKGLLIGVSTPVFDRLYNSYTKLNEKLAAKSKSAGGHNQRLHEDLSPPNSSNHALEKASGQDCEQNQWSNKARGPKAKVASSGISQKHNEESFDRCCVCGTLASEEELTVTTCCSTFVGSLCFEEAMQETGKCYLCQEILGRAALPEPAAYSELSDYKVHFVEVQKEAEDLKKDVSAIGIDEPSETGNACPSQEESRPDLVSAHRTETVNAIMKWRQWTERESETWKPDDRSIQGRRSPPNLSTEPNHKPHEAPAIREVQRLEPLEKGPEDSGHTKEYEFVLRLFDQPVISYLEGLSWKDLSGTVREALRESLPHTEHTTTFFGIPLLESGDIRIKYGIDKWQARDLEGSTESWAGALEKFVRGQLGTFTVTLHDIAIETMDLTHEVQRMRTIEELVGYNASAMQFLSRPDDIRLIRWTTNEKRLRKFKGASVTMILATAAQANEVIARGLYWKGERRFCVKEGPKRRLVQCDGCQDFGHTANECSSAPRCQACAEGHQTKDCPLGLNPSPRSLKCALCGGHHSARDFFCTVRRGEDERLRHENRSYPTDTESVPAASTSRQW